MKVLRMPMVKEKTGLSKAMIYIRISQGTFPKSIDLGPNSVGWLEEEVNQWIKERISERDRKLSA